MDNPEKLATYGTQGEEKQSKTTTQYVLDTTIHKTYVETKEGEIREQYISCCSYCKFSVLSYCVSLHT
jgi:hypothetical protein